MFSSSEHGHVINGNWCLGLVVIVFSNIPFLIYLSQISQHRGFADHYINHDTQRIVHVCTYVYGLATPYHVAP
jgi:hypothetical protein